MRTVRAPIALLLLVPLAACATHNAHRVPIDLNADLAAQIDEAWAAMEAARGEVVPVGAVPVEVVVEPVEVEWLPHSPEVPPGGSVIPQAEMQRHIEDALRSAGAPTSPDATRRVRVKLAVDLHEPDALETQVRVALIDPDGRPLATGCSGLVRFERLYCHGCRDRWIGHGSSLTVPSSEGTDALAASGGFFFYYPSSSSGYTKN